MARVELPIVVLNSTTGLPVNGASISITKRSTGSAATWFAAETGGVGSTAAVITDANGRASGWLDRGAYNLTVSGTGITTYTEPWDATPGGDSTLDVLWIPDGTITWPKMSVANGAIPAAKIANGIAASQLADSFLKQFGGGLQRQFNWGTASLDQGGFFSQNAAIRGFPHGLPGTPVWAMVQCTPGNTSGDPVDPIICSVSSLDATNIFVRIRSGSGAGMSFPGINAYWIALI